MQNDIKINEYVKQLGEDITEIEFFTRLLENMIVYNSNSEPGDSAKMIVILSKAVNSAKEKINNLSTYVEFGKKDVLK